MKQSKIKMLLLVILISFYTFLSIKTLANENKLLELKKGSFLHAMSTREISTETSDEGDIVTFMNPENVYYKDDIILPKGALYIGYIEQIREPVQGNNASIKIKIIKVIYPNNQEYDLKAIVGNDENYVIGSEQTAPMYYNKVPHYSRLARYGVIQLCPVNVFEWGKHTKISAGANFTIMLLEDFKIEIAKYN